MSTWHYKPLKFPDGLYRIVETYEIEGEKDSMRTDEIVPASETAQGLLRVLIMMVYDVSKYALKEDL